MRLRRRTAGLHAITRLAALTAIAALTALTLTVAVSDGPPRAAAQAAPLTLDTLRHAGYPSEFTADGAAPLTDGEYREPAAPGSASMVIVTFIDAAIADDFAAVVLATSAGGSGTFYTLHLVSNESGALTAGAGTLLGDRVVLHAITIDGADVRVALTAHAESDPLCCPTREETRVYGFTADGFRLLSTTPGVAPITPAPAETGSAGLAARAGGSMPAALAMALAVVALVTSARAVVRRRA